MIPFNVFINLLQGERMAFMEAVNAILEGLDVSFINIFIIIIDVIFYFFLFPTILPILYDYNFPGWCSDMIHFRFYCWQTFLNFNNFLETKVLLLFLEFLLILFEIGVTFFQIVDHFFILHFFRIFFF